MARKKNEAKVTFTAETADMQKEIKKADSVLRELRSELKLNSEEMKTTGESAEGLSKQHEILQKEADQYEAKVEALNAKLKAANEIFGEQSEEASRIRTTINNTNSAYEKIKQSINETEQAIKAQNDAMGEVQDETKTTETAYERLTRTIEKQRNELDQLETEYKNAVLQYGKNSTEAKQLKSQMQSLSGELEDNEKTMDQLEKTAKKAAGRMDELGDAAGDTKEGFTVAKGAMATFAGNAMTGMIGAAKNGLTTLYNLADETREYRNEMSKLSSAAQSNGYSVDFAKEKYLDMYAVLADETAANTTVSNFMAMKMSQDDLNTVLNAATGIWAKYGDSIPLDGLAESVNETANTATVTGNLADALNWAGISEDDFNKKLAKCKTTQERQNLIVKTLDKTYGKLGTSYKQNNKSVMEANRATAEYNDTMADLGAEMEPITTSVKRGFTEVVKAAMGLVDADVDKAAEKIGDAFEWVAENIETIVNVAKVGGMAIAGMFVVNKAANFISSIRTVTSTMGLFRTATAAATAATTAQTAAQTGLNAAMLANPIGIIVAGAAALTAAIGATVAIQKQHEEQLRKEAEKTYGLSDAQKELMNSIHETYQANKEAATARTENMNKISQEYVYYEKLADELSTLVDANGKVKKGYEDRAKVITGILSEALGIEIDVTDGVVQNYGKLNKSIQKVIETKKAEALLNANEEAYTTAIQNQQKAFENLANAKETLAQKTKASADAEDNYKQKLNEYISAAKSGKGASRQWSKELEKARIASEEANEALDKAKDGVKEAEETWVDYNTTIKNYEGLSEAIVSGDAKKIQEAISKTTYSFIDAENGTKESLERQVKNARKTYEQLKQAVASGAPGVTQEMVDEAKTMVNLAEAELNKLQPKAKSSLKKAGSEANSGLASAKAVIKDTSQKIANLANNMVGSADTKTTGKKEGNDYNSGLGSTKKTIGATAKSVSNEANKNLGSANTKTTGKKKGTDFGTGISGAQKTAVTAAKNTASKVEKEFKSINTYSYGKNVSQGLASGIKKGMYTAISAAQSVANSVQSTIKKALKINSPSKVMIPIGAGVPEGLAVGVKKDEDLVKKACIGLSNVVTRSFDGMNDQNIHLGVQEDYHRTLETTFNSRLESELLNLQTTLEAIKNIKFVLNINGQTFATATAGNYDSVNGTRLTLKGRGISV